MTPLINKNIEDMHGLITYSVASGFGGGAVRLVPAVLKRAKTGGRAPLVFLKNDAHFDGILILVFSMCL